MKTAALPADPPLRFVLLEHDPTPRASHMRDPLPLHWDLMLQLPGGLGLATWRLAANPLVVSEIIAAEAIGDHRIAYLDYEGEIGGDRGTVRRVDSGTLTVIRKSSAVLRFRLFGARLQEQFEIETGSDGTSTLRRANAK